MLQRSFGFVKRATTDKYQSRAYEEHRRHRDRLSLFFSRHDVNTGKSCKHHHDRGEHNPHRDPVGSRRKLTLRPIPAVKSIAAWLLTVRSRKTSAGANPLGRYFLSACDHCGHYRWIRRPPHHSASRNHSALPEPQTRKVRDKPSATRPQSCRAAAAWWWSTRASSLPMDCRSPSYP